MNNFNTQQQLSDYQQAFNYNKQQLLSDHQQASKQIPEFNSDVYNKI